MPRNLINTITVESNQIRVVNINDDDYISLTDIAKSKDWEMEPRHVISRWMSNRNTVEFLGIWEEIHNQNFNRTEFDTVRQNAGLNSFTLTPKKWIEDANSIGFTSKSGKYGGTYAHKDIAFEFGMWISPRFKLLLIKEFQRLKETESKRLDQEWNYSRYLAKANYTIHTDAIKEVLVPISTLPENRKGIIYADEAELLNVALFDTTSREWRQNNPKKVAKGENIRDYASVSQLTVLANLESYNAVLIRKKIQPERRLRELRDLAILQLKTISNSKYVLGADSVQQITEA